MRRLTGLDASFLYLETPNNHMHVASTFVYEPGLTYDKVRAVVENRLHLLPPFRWRLVDVPFGLHHPVWIEDPDFDLDFHLRRATVSAPGDGDALVAMAADFMSRPLDRRRPLWEMWVVDGLEGGRVALLSKTHHAVIDGATGAELAARLLDVSPEPVVHPPADPPWKPEREPSAAEMLAYASGSLARQPVRLVRAVVDTVGRGLKLRERSRDEGMRAPVALFSAPKTSFSRPVSERRTIGFSEVPLADLKAVRAAFGGTVNDVVLAVCAGALRRYLAERDELPDSALVAMVPISVRSVDQRGEIGNRITNMLVALGTDVDDPVARLRAIQHNTKDSKEFAGAIGADTLSNWAEFAAPALAARAARLYSSLRLADRHKPIFNLTISNIPGPAIALYSAGSKMLAWYPMAPIFDGSGLNITVMSYMGTVFVGVVACAESVPRIGDLVRAIEDSVAELKACVELAAAPAAAGTKQPARKAAPKRKPAPKLPKQTA